MKPRLVESVQNDAGKEIKKYPAKEYKELFEPEMAEKLKTYMASVIKYGTATRLNQYANLRVYGKTGTAEIDSERNSNSWFIGFAEQKDTKENYTIVVVTENIPDGTYPAPAVTIAGQVLKVLD